MIYDFPEDRVCRFPTKSPSTEKKNLTKGINLHLNRKKSFLLLFPFFFILNNDVETIIFNHVILLAVFFFYADFPINLFMQPFRALLIKICQICTGKYNVILVQINQVKKN